MQALQLHGDIIKLPFNLKFWFIKYQRINTEKKTCQLPMYVTSADIAEHIVDLLISSAIFLYFQNKRLPVLFHQWTGGAYKSCTAKRQIEGQRFYIIPLFLCSHWSCDETCALSLFAASTGCTPL